MPRTRLHSIHHSMLPPLWMLSTPSDMNVINYHQIGADVDWYIERSCSFTVDLRSHLWVMTMGTGRGEKGRLPVCGVVSSSSSSLSMRVDRPCGEKRRRIGAIPRRIVLLVGKGRTGFFLIFIFVINRFTKIYVYTLFFTPRIYNALFLPSSPRNRKCLEGECRGNYRRI